MPETIFETPWTRYHSNRRYYNGAENKLDPKSDYDSETSVNSVLQAETLTEMQSG